MKTNELEPGERDAIHVPVICLRAHKVLYAGEPVGIHGESTCRGIEGTVDPFQESPVDSGNPVVVWLKPGSVSDVRHAWHFLNEENPEPKKPDYEWWSRYQEGIAEKLECSVYVLEDGIRHMIEYGTSEGGPQPNLETTGNVDWKEFWRVYNECHGTQYAWEEDPFCC